MCKLVLSAAINQYEPVTLYNFHKTGNKLAKISGGLSYMNRLDSSHDDELLLIVDGFDEWFQLPASIMEARYHDINRRENERILTRTGHTYQQSIVISTQRQCWPGIGADISCYAAPESPLPAYIFGPETDNMVDEWNRYARLRSRYMNAGYIMGPVKAMRELWTRAQQYADDDPKVVGLDQNILARIWGEQNYVREFARFNGEPLIAERPNHNLLPSRRDKSGTKAKLRKRNIGYPNDKASPARKTFDPKDGTNYEFGIGLDYGSELSLPTVFAEYDADWLTFSNATSLSTAFKAQNVTHAGATHLQTDIAALPATPFAALKQHAPHYSSTLGAKAASGATFDNEGEQSAQNTFRKLIKNTTWNDVPLFTNMWTGITPAIVHHNAWRDGLKDRRRTTWTQMWFQPYARDLLDAWAATQKQLLLDAKSNKRTPGDRLATKARRWVFLGRRDSESRDEEATRKADTTEMKGLGTRTDNDEEGNWASWRDLCGDKQQEEVFRDKLGPWRGPGGEGVEKKEWKNPAEEEKKRKQKEEEEEKKKKEKNIAASPIVHNEPSR